MIENKEVYLFIQNQMDVCNYYILKTLSRYRGTLIPYIVLMFGGKNFNFLHDSVLLSFPKYLLCCILFI